MWLIGAALVVAPGSLLAQMPGAPVLQNAWAAPGTVVAVDFAGGGGSTVYAGAFAWAPASGRYQFSAGLGWQSIQSGSSRGVYGARVAFPLMQAMSGRLGFAGFAGIGGGPAKSTNLRDSTQAKLIVPAGVAIGYRQAIGTAGRGFSVHVAPQYQHRTQDSGNMAGFHVGYGLDASLSPRFGLTVGGESGASGAARTTWGIALSMKLGR